MLKTVLLVVLAGVVLLLVVAATRPDRFHVERSLTIAAPADVLFARIDNLREMNRWNPYAQKDPAMKETYEGPAAGPGSGYAFEGNAQAGSGRIDVTASTPGQRVEMRLQMVKPFPADNQVAFTLQPDGAGATRVTWAMDGPSPYIAKVMGLVFSMDRMVGGEFDRGLAQLKALAEAR
jgi:hypothetical protein